MVETNLTKPTGTSLDEIRYTTMPGTYSACPVDEAVQQFKDELKRRETVKILKRRVQERFVRTIAFMDSKEIYLRVGEGKHVIHGLENVRRFVSRDRYSAFADVLPAMMQNLREKLEEYKHHGPNPSFEHCANKWLKQMQHLT